MGFIDLQSALYVGKEEGLTMITLYLLSNGSTIVSLNSIPSVMYLIRVRVGDDRSSNRIAYPTSSPRTVPTSSATLVATLVAATRRGCVQATTWFWPDHPASCRYCGISTSSAHLAPPRVMSQDCLRVDFPHPVCPTTITTRYFSTHHNSFCRCL
jgi:hypothetical protein